MNNLFKRAGALLLCLSMLMSAMCITGCGAEVNTYSVAEMAYVDEWINTSESSGEVTTVNMQTVYGSETIEVRQIFVSQGQKVKKGDKLLSYDTSLTDIELEKKELEVMELELDLRQAEQELSEISKYKPMVVTTITPPAVPQVSGSDVSGWKQIGGSGTENDPYIFVVEDGKIPCSTVFMDGVCPPGTAEAWTVFQERKDDRTNGKILNYWGLCYTHDTSGVSMTFFDAGRFSQNPITEPYEEIQFNSGLSAAEISRMKAAAKERVKDADYEYRLADLEYRQMLLEVDNGIITAELDGIIEFASDDARTSIELGEPLVKLSDNGGYLVQGTLSELELGTVSVGQKVKVTSWENYGEYEAQIESISDIPSEQNGWTNGNPNVSYYPFTVYIDGSANLREYEYVSLSYNSKGEVEEGFFLERPFVLSENGRSYVYVQTPEGTLEKREIETGELLWGSYIRIVSGISMEDRIAFPYDKNAKNGARAREAAIEELYMY